MDDEKKNAGFKVNDRRRFDDSGNDRDHEAPQTGSAASAGSGKAGRSASGASEITFTSFVMSLATQALMQMGQLPAPGGQNIETDISAAKQVIDILGKLEKKTAGNLDPEEAKLFQDILHGVRLSFLQITTSK